MGRRRVLLETRRQFWRLIAEGASSESAAALVGVALSGGKRWFVEAGGMSPICLDEPTGRYLSHAEREEIAVGLAGGLSDAVIGDRLGRDRSTIWRERQRNTMVRHPGEYRARVAQHKAEQRARRPKPTKLSRHPVLAAVTQEMLDGGCSPEQAAGRLPLDFPADPEMRVSTETIYREVYIQARGTLNRDLKTCLRTGRAVRKPRRRAGARKSRIPDMVMISERPAEIADRDAWPGNWEGDLIIGTASGSAIGTLVERTSRFTMLLHLPDDHSAEAVRDAIIDAFSQIPAALRQSLTWDQGVELTRHAEIKAATDMAVYFCDPHSPWQRGLNENTNGLLRQYYPKGTDLSVHSPAHLAAVAAQLNARPRKAHGFRTPAEVFGELLFTHAKTVGVATTG